MSTLFLRRRGSAAIHEVLSLQLSTRLKRLASCLFRRKPLPKRARRFRRRCKRQNEVRTCSSAPFGAKYAGHHGAAAPHGSGVERTDPARNDFRKPNKWPCSHAKCHVLCHTPENFPKVPQKLIQRADAKQMGGTDGQRKYFLILHTKVLSNITYAQFQRRSHTHASCAMPHPQTPCRRKKISWRYIKCKARQSSLFRKRKIAHA